MRFHTKLAVLLLLVVPFGLNNNVEDTSNI
jgi:hypothetical protein